MGYDSFLKKKFTNIYLVRHSDIQDKHLTGGWTESGISEVGILQAYALAKKILDDELKLEAIITSTLQRAKKTATILSNHLEIGFNLEHGLRTINNGILAGMSKHDPRYLQIQKKLKDPNFQIEGGESIASFKERINDTFHALVSQFKNQTILLVTHGRVIQEILRMILQCSNKSNVQFGVYPTGMTNIWVYEDGSITIQKVNNTSHLSQHLLVSDVQ